MRQRDATLIPQLAIGLERFPANGLGRGRVAGSYQQPAQTVQGRHDQAAIAKLARNGEALFGQRPRGAVF